jgi:hypothetical protein
VIAHRAKRLIAAAMLVWFSMLRFCFNRATIERV